MKIATNKVEYVTISSVAEMANVDDLLIHFTGEYTIGDTDISLINIHAAINTLEKELIDYENNDEDIADKLRKALTALKELDSSLYISLEEI